ncbi:hypothetical protein [Acidiphilium sp.]|uniref:hypothetical protein n=1 Tax=Acidiphilium sp. TaxID=527 RepID=UPI003CFD5301
MLDSAIGLSLYLTAIAFVLHGIRARRLRRLEADEPVNPMIFAAGEIMRPILQIIAAYAAVKTTFMYWALGGPRLFPLVDFGGLLAVIAAYGVWIQLKMQPLATPGEGHIEPAPPPAPKQPALPPELIPHPSARELELAD